MLRPIALAAFASVSSLFLLGACSDALTSSDCPGTPGDLKLEPLAPFWGGLVALDYRVPDGVPDSIEVDVFNPASQVWEQSYGTLDQRSDDTYVSLVNVGATASTKDAERKLRVRSRLQGCPVSDWAESQPFKLGDPLAGTTWRAELAPSASGTINVYLPNGTGPISYLGPYHFDADTKVIHTISFASDGTTSEEIRFAIASDHSGDGYAGCVFDLHFTGNYQLKFTPSLHVDIRDRKKAANATDGSSCSSPSLANMAISQAAVDTNLGDVSPGIYIDYTRLLESPPGDVRWDSSDLAQGLFQALGAISVVTGIETTSVSGSFYFTDAGYIKQ